jgi:hypothetical protein
MSKQRTGKGEKSKKRNYPPRREMTARFSRMTRNELLRHVCRWDKKIRVFFNAWARIEESRLAKK